MRARVRSGFKITNTGSFDEVVIIEDGGETPPMVFKPRDTYTFGTTMDSKDYVYVYVNYNKYNVKIQELKPRGVTSCQK